MTARHRMAALHCLLVGLVATSACRASASDRPPPPAVRDSAGVAIVENQAPAWGRTRGFRIEQRPLLDLGGVAGDTALDFSAVNGAVRLASGRLAVADEATGQIRIFDQRGLMVRRLGGRGTGPGEFAALSALQQLPGDSIAAWDRARALVTVFGPDGRVARSVSLAGDEGAGVAPAQAIGVMASGEVLGSGLPRVTDRPVPQKGVWRDSVAYVAVAPDGRRRTVGHFPSDELVVRAGGRQLTVARVPFGRGAVAAVRGAGFVLGEGEAEIGVYDASGALRRSIRWPARPAAVTAADSARFIADLVAGVHDQLTRQQREGFWRTVPFARTLPAHGAIRVGVGGELWVTEPGAYGERAARTHVFAPDGRWLGTLTLPDRFTLLEAGTDYLLGSWKDADEVEHVRMYGLKR